MAANTPDEPHFWGGETLADRPLFTVHMDAESSRVSVHLNRAMGPDYYAWLTFKYSDWSDFHRRPPSKRDHGSAARISATY